MDIGKRVCGYVWDGVESRNHEKRLSLDCALLYLNTSGEGGGKRKGGLEVRRGRWLEHGASKIYCFLSGNEKEWNDRTRKWTPPLPTERQYTLMYLYS